MGPLSKNNVSVPIRTLFTSIHTSEYCEIKIIII